MREKSLEKKNTILKVTLELIAEQGFHGTSISQIADRSKVNVGSIYYHFKNKDDILNALYIDSKSRMTQWVFRDCAEDLPVDEKLRHIMVNIIRYYNANQEELSFIEQYERSPYISEIILIEEYKDIMKKYIDIYEQLMIQGLIKDLPIDVIYNLVSGAVVSLAKYCVSITDALEESVLLAAIEAIWDMVKK